VADLQIRPLTPDDDIDAQVDLAQRAFGVMSAAQRADWVYVANHRISQGTFLGAFLAGQPVGAATIHDMRQWWHGRAVPMAGVASVAVAPEERGRGVGRSLMTALLELIAARGYPLSVLFPSTLPLYRSLGWEIAGTSHEAVIPAHALRSLAPPDAALPAAAGPRPAPGDLRRAGPGDAAAAVAALDRAHGGSGDCGPGVPDAELLRLALGSGEWFGYLADDGLLLYGWRSGHDEVFVRLAVAASERTTRALWAIVSSHCWVADTVRARVGPADPVWWLTREPVADVVDHDDWMLRVVDPAAAVAARGFPPAARLAVPLRIADAARSANSGLWRLQVSGGRGSLSRDDSGTVGHGPLTFGARGLAAGGTDGHGPLTFGARGLAALYAGTPVATLRRAGLAAGGDAAGDALLDGAFAARPYMLDRF
jgi:predicted N-acetyltransferase YhbS